MSWTADKIERLRELWRDQALSACEIGRRLGMSKNAVVGKAHRLNLPGRPSPNRTAAAPRPERAPRRTLPPLAALRATPGSPAACTPTTEAFRGSPGSNLGAVAAPFPRVQPGAAVAGTAEAQRRAGLATQTRRLEAHRGIEGRLDAMLPKPLAAVEFRRLSKPCCWRIGEPRTKEFRFCGAPGVPGKSCCEAHLAVSRLKRVEAA